MDLIRISISRQQLIDFTEESIKQSGIAEHYAEKLRHVARTATQVARGDMFCKIEDGTTVGCPLDAAGLYVPAETEGGEWLPENGTSFFTSFDVLTGDLSSPPARRANILEVTDD